MVSDLVDKNCCCFMEKAEVGREKVEEVREKAGG